MRFVPMHEILAMRRQNLGIGWVSGQVLHLAGILFHVDQLFAPLSLRIDDVFGGETVRGTIMPTSTVASPVPLPFPA